ncbi:hypothetical protein M3212_09565 [Alkalihalobacillus oceani]|uniref:hypothetical protein n=1 Tax=Halalkalibacter oceani TaxID=1653776 RepID=UPI00203D029F|nr:hypothetical protein [Halalkalibacter oceani]MCM3761031.1 hypothetical protein [Halalkalibacter oceani]
MAEQYRFFDSIDGEDERTYTADEFAEYFRQLVSSGIFNGGGNLQVTSSGMDMTIMIHPGYAWLEGYLYKVDTEPLVLPVAAADAEKDRIDRVIIRLDKRLENRYVKAFVLTGEPSETPEAPELTRDGNVFELSLAHIVVEKGKSYLDESAIHDERFDTDVCGLVNSLIHIDASHLIEAFEGEWQQWFDGIQNATFQTKEDFENDVLDYAGTYQQTFGFEDVLTDNCSYAAGEITLSGSKNIIFDNYTGSTVKISGTGYQIGQRLLPALTQDLTYIHAIELYLSVVKFAYSSNPYIYISVFDVTLDEELVSRSFTKTVFGDSVGYKTFALNTPVTPGHTIDIRIRCSVPTDDDLRFRINHNHPPTFSATTHFIESTNQWAHTLDWPEQSLAFRIQADYENTEGRVYKTLTFPEFERWGVLTWEGETPAGTAITCDVLKNEPIPLDASVLDVPTIKQNVADTSPAAVHFQLGFQPLNNRIKGSLVLAKRSTSYSTVIELYDSKDGKPNQRIAAALTDSMSPVRQIGTSDIPQVETNLVSFEFEPLAHLLVEGADYYIVIQTDGNTTYPNYLGCVIDEEHPNLFTGSAFNPSSNRKAYIQVEGLSGDHLLQSGLANEERLETINEKDIILKWTLTKEERSLPSPQLQTMDVTWKGRAPLHPVTTGHYNESVSIPARSTYIKRIPLQIPARRGSLFMKGTGDSNFCQVYFNSVKGAAQIVSSYLTSGNYRNYGGFPMRLWFIEETNVFLEAVYIHQHKEIVLVYRNNNTSTTSVNFTGMWEVSL